MVDYYSNLCEYPDKLYLSRNKRNCAIGRWKPHDRIFIHLNETPERDGRTDGRRDRIPLIQRSVLRATRTRCKKTSLLLHADSW